MKKLLVAAIMLATWGSAYADHHKGKGPGHHNKMMMEKMDADKNGEISKDEWNKHHEEMFSKLDANSDGKITKEEFEANHKEMMGKMKKKGKKPKKAKKEEDN